MHVFPYGCLHFAAISRVLADLLLGHLVRLFEPPQFQNQSPGIECSLCAETHDSMVEHVWHITNRCAAPPDNVQLLWAHNSPIAFFVRREIIELLASTPGPGGTLNHYPRRLDVLDPMAMPFRVGPRTYHNSPQFDRELNREMQLCLSTRNSPKTLWTLVRSKLNWLAQDEHERHPAVARAVGTPLVLSASFLKPLEDWSVDDLAMLPAPPDQNPRRQEPGRNPQG